MRRALVYARIASWRIWNGPIGSWRWKISAFFLSKAVNLSFKNWQDWAYEDNYEQGGVHKIEDRRVDRLH